MIWEKRNQNQNRDDLGKKKLEEIKEIIYIIITHNTKSRTAGAVALAEGGMC